MPSSRTLLILFPTGHEAGALPWRDSGWKLEKTFSEGKLLFSRFSSGDRTVLQCVCGMGAEGVSEAIQAAGALGRDAFVLLAGYAGGLAPGLAVGDLIASAPPFALRDVPWRLGTCSTVQDVVADDDARARLHQSTGSLICDMEWEPLVHACAQAGFPHGFLRAISDGIGSVVPARALAAAYDRNRRRPNPAGLIAHLIRHPADIFPVAAFIFSLQTTRARLRHGLGVWLGAWQTL